MQMRASLRRILIAAMCPILAVSSLAGCATASNGISATYVSQLQYQNYDCQQIQQESLRLQARVNELGGRLDEAATHDKQIAGVGIILFWPVLFALGGTKAQEAEYGRLKGENEALQQAAISKKCMASAPVPPVPAGAASAVALAPAAPAAAVPGNAAASAVVKQ